MPFRFLLRNRHGDDAGTFVTAVPDWRVGEVYMRRPGDYFRIVAIDDAPDDETHGVWTVEPVDADAAVRSGPRHLHLGPALPSAQAACQARSGTPSAGRSNS